jgi:hypothetical protein
VLGDGTTRSGNGVSTPTCTGVLGQPAAIENRPHRPAEHNAVKRGRCCKGQHDQTHFFKFTCSPWALIGKSRWQLNQTLIPADALRYLC